MLSAGTSIGPFEIVGPLGAGGMGVVYRARDTQLHREVALKLLPAGWAADPDRDARFTREAQTLASLNHPHIAQIYGVERSGEHRALVMELVEGEDLAARLVRGALPVGEALMVARQIADALDSAHSAGIVHRDIKPANVKVRQDGTVKVLEFGLARGSADRADFADGAGPGTMGQSPTFAPPAMTQAGMILGTAAYMSPEQARGKTIDKRTDIWAFGCVLFEMLTGRPAFDGETITDVLGSIVKTEPDWSALPADTPRALEKLLKRLLQKDVAKRLRDIGDARVEIDELAAAPPEPRASPPATTSPASRVTGRVAVAWAAAVALIAAAAAAAVYLQTPPEARLRKLTVPVDGDNLVREVVMSPDGSRLAYADAVRLTLFVRTLGEWTARELAGTEGAVQPFWSPDNQWLAFIRNEQLLKVPANGGPVVRVATLPAVQAPLRLSTGTWTDDGSMIVSLGPGPLLRVAASGGAVAPLDGIEAPGAFLRDVQQLPNGRLIVVISRVDAQDALAVIEDGALRVIHEAEGLRRPVYSPPGYLIFSREEGEGGLWAAPFSLARMTLTGDPFLVAEGRDASVSRDGTLAYIPRVDLRRHLSWFSLEGRIGPPIAEPRDWIEGVSLSRDGRRLLASTTDGIWAYDTQTGARSRVTTGTSDLMPKWIDADTMVYVRIESSTPVLVLRELAPPGRERVLARDARFPTVARDGTRVVFNIRDDSQPGVWNIAWIDLDRPADVHRLLEPHRGARFPSVSPDGTLVSYVSGEMGPDEIFLTRLPSGDGKWQLSSSGGGWTLFHPSGTSVLYRTAGTLMRVAVTNTGTDVQIGKAEALFPWNGTWAPFYDIAADGVRGVAALPLDAVRGRVGIALVQNWWLEFPDPTRR